jgi:hypothetical protein
MADYNSPGLILNQSELQSNGLNTSPNLYMSTGVGGGKVKRKSQKRIKKGGDCGCNKSLIKGGKKQRKIKKGGKKQTKKNRKR